MSLNNSAVLVPGHGRFFTAPTDTPPPGQLLKITGNPTQATLTLTVNSVSVNSVVLPSTAAISTKMTTIANALAGLSTVGSGNVVVLPGPDAWTFLILLMPEVLTPALSATGTYTGGTSPAVTVSSTGRSADFTTYSEVGHTGQDNPLQVNRSGGDVTTVGSWQQDSIDSSTAPVTESLAFSLLQYDVANMKLYYGANATLGADGTFQTNPAGATPTEEALFLVIRNGAKAQGRYWPRVSFGPADGENFDTSKLAEMPVAAQVLQSNTLSYGKGISPTGVAA